MACNPGHCSENCLCNSDCDLHHGACPTNNTIADVAAPSATKLQELRTKINNERTSRRNLAVTPIADTTNQAGKPIRASHWHELIAGLLTDQGDFNNGGYSFVADTTAIDDTGRNALVSDANDMLHSCVCDSYCNQDMTCSCHGDCGCNYLVAGGTECIGHDSGCPIDTYTTLPTCPDHDWGCLTDNAEY